MAATLFIIKIPVEESKIVPDCSENNKKDLINIKSSTNIHLIHNSFESTDLETDARKVLENEECNCTPSLKVNTTKNTKTNEPNTQNEDNTSSERNETTDTLLDKGQLRHADSESIIFSTPQSVNKKECPNHERTEEEIYDPIVEKLDDPTSPEVTMLDFLTKEPLETQLKNLLEAMSITTVNWSSSEGYQQVLFTDCGDPQRVEDILEKLISIGIGQKIVGTSVSLFPATVHIENMVDDKEDDCLSDSQKEDESEFLKSVKSRMIVAQVVETVRSNALFTFDYCVLIILASMIACIGLVENSSVILVASMLISPLMGPILAGTFGITIKNGPLRNLGICSECIGLSICILCGFICGLIVGGIQQSSGPVDEWPTMEMKSRGMSRSLWVGVLIALPSGAGVALSVLGGNTGSLVGVAISASLLPPAVNAGMMWAFAVLAELSPVQFIPVTNSSDLRRGELGCPPFQHNEYEPVYNCNMAIEMGFMGVISLLLTLINIICIFLVGVIMLKIKEVVPQISPANTAEFWGSDLKVARDSYKTLKGAHSANLQQKFRNELEKLKAYESEKNTKRNIDFERIMQRMASSLPTDPYWTLPCNSPTLEEEPTTHHTIHGLPYSKLFNYRTMVPSPGIRVLRPFSFPNYKESPTKRSKSKKHKKVGFNIIGKNNKRTFTVTSVPESSLLQTSIDKETLS